jgi:hypothetical protein
VATYQADLGRWKRTLDAIMAAAELPFEQRQARFRELSPELEAIRPSTERLTREAGEYLGMVDGCGKGLAGVAGAMRSGAEQVRAGAERMQGGAPLPEAR